MGQRRRQRVRSRCCSLYVTWGFLRPGKNLRVNLIIWDPSKMPKRLTVRLRITITHGVILNLNRAGITETAALEVRDPAPTDD